MNLLANESTSPGQALQLSLFEAFATDAIAQRVASDKPADELDLESYDRYVVAFSGGKDSLACLLHLFEMGIEAERIHLHHHHKDLPVFRKVLFLAKCLGGSGDSKPHRSTWAHEILRSKMGSRHSIHRLRL